jgi:nickel/cobalt transporter (NicO) family protein
VIPVSSDPLRRPFREHIALGRSELTPSKVFQFAACLAATIAFARPVEAHPLGNFTINHLVKVGESEGIVGLRYVLDMAEIPTFQVMRARDASGKMSGAELHSWALDEARDVAPSIEVRADGTRLTLEAGTPAASTRPGAGGLPTLYWVETYRAPIPPGTTRLTVRDESYAGRIGWKDIVVGAATEPTDELRHYPSALLGSPRDVTSATAIVTKAGLRVASGATDAAVAELPGASQIKSNALSDMLARGTSNPWIVLITLLAAVGLGALHAAEPGHGKTLLAVSLVGARATPKQALLLAIGLTAAHTAGVIILGGLLLVAARWIVPEAIYPWITLVSGAAVAILGAGALARFIHTRRGAAHAYGGDTRSHDLDHDHGHDHGLAGDEALTFRGVMLVAMSGNIAPCPAALVVLLAALALHEVAYGIAVVIAFSVGLAAILTGLGIALVRGAACIARKPAFDSIATYAPLASACVISVIGAVMFGQGAAASAFGAPPVTAAVLVLTAIAAYALSPGHAHAHHHAHDRAGAQ